MTRLKALLVAGLALVMVLGTVGVASARMHFVDAGRDVHLVGHGYGHGIGMSQYGAEGAAQQGKTWGQIVRFYYPGTNVGNEPNRWMRVLITADTTADVKVMPVSGLRIRDFGRRTWGLPSRASIKRWRVNPNGWVQRYEDGGWHRWKRMDGDSEFYRSGDRPIGLVLPNGSVAHYRGRLRSTHNATVNVLRLEQYLRGVVPEEMPASWSQHALRSQAVAARTYAMRLRAQHPGRYYQICDTTSCQVYGGAEAEHGSTDTAIRATAGKVVRYGGEFALTMFSSSNGGRTANGGMPYLVAKKDPWDGWSGNPNHRWTESIPASRIESAYPSLGRLIGIDIVRRDGGGRWGGRVERLVLDGTRDNVTTTGQDIRFRFGLRSHWFQPNTTAIGNRWRRLGGASGRLGGTDLPEYATNGGAGQIFDRGRIYWSRDTGAHEIYGAILRRYKQMRGAKGRLGFPETGEVAAGVPGSRTNRFERGRIYWSRDTGAHEVYGAIFRRYARMGGAGGRLGLPVTGEHSVPGGRASDFQHGRLVWDRSTNKVTVHYY